MGYSPGEFNDRWDEGWHWELKDGPRIVLWTRDELKRILDLTYTQAKEAVEQLQFLINMIELDNENNKNPR